MLFEPKLNKSPSQSLALEKTVLSPGRLHITMRFEYLLYVTVAELILGGGGRYIVIKGITVRFALFLALFYFWIIKKFKKGNITLSTQTKYIVSFFEVFIIVGIAVGLINKNELSEIFGSVNGYLYFLLILPFEDELNTPKKVETLVTVFKKSAWVIAFLNIIFWLLLIVSRNAMFNRLNPFLFNHYFGHLALTYFPRVFLKGCVFIIPLLLLKLSEVYHVGRFSMKSLRDMFILLFALFTTMTIGFWLGFFVGVSVIFMTNIGWKKIFKFLLVTFIFIVSLELFTGHIMTKYFQIRLRAKDPSALTRVAQAPMLWKSFLESPVVGKGFGYKIAFRDKGNASKLRQTSAFELFYLELLKDSGLVGFIFYALLFWILLRKFRSIKKSQHLRMPTACALLAGTVAVYFITGLNPLLNNPLGIGFVIIAYTYLNYYQQEKQY